MKLPRKRFLIPLILVALLVAFHQFARPVWHPWWIKFRGGKTTAEVVKELGPRMDGVFADLDQLIDGKPIALLGFKDERRLEL